MDELKKYGDNIVINDYEISVLSKCNIDVTKCKTIADDADLEDEEYEEIDFVANNLSERLYYMGNK